MAVFPLAVSPPCCSPADAGVGVGQDTLHRLGVQPTGDAQLCPGHHHRLSPAARVTAELRCQGTEPAAPGPALGTHQYTATLSAPKAPTSRSAGTSGVLVAGWVAPWWHAGDTR